MIWGADAPGVQSLTVRDLDWGFICSLAFVATVGACGDDASPSLTTTTDANTSTGEDLTTTGVQPPSDSDSGTTDTGTPGSTSSDGGSSESTAAADSTTSGPATDGEETGMNTAVCGNNIIEGDELCDLGQLAGETCQSQGFQGGQLGCLLTCEAYNTLGCFVCGNGIVDLPEDCEGEIDEKTTCETLGFQDGTVTCGADCLYDTSDCSICGDGIRQGPEACDGLDLGGETCESLGFDEGVLGCNIPTCGHDFSGCSGGQYFQDFEGGALPAEFTLDGDADWFIDGGSAMNGTFSMRGGDVNDNESTSVFLDAIFGVDGEISFEYRVTSEACCDSLEFYIDGSLIDSWGGTLAQATHTSPVTAGAHTFQWRYEKDISISTGEDTAWVDDIALVPGVPVLP